MTHTVFLILLSLSLSLLLSPHSSFYIRIYWNGMMDLLCIFKFASIAW